MTITHLWQPGDRVNWDASSSRGYGYQPSIAAIVRKLGEKKVQIDVARKPPYEKQWVIEQKWVDPLALRPRRIPVSALGESLELEVVGFRIEFVKSPYGTQTFFYGTVDGWSATAPSHSPEHALSDAVHHLHSGGLVAGLRSFIDVVERNGTQEKDALLYEQANALLKKCQNAIFPLNIVSDEAELRAVADGVSEDNRDDSPHYFPVESGMWQETSHYPLDRLQHEGCFASRATAYHWLANEIQMFRDDGMPERAESYRRMLFERIREPVIIGEVDKQAKVWDGWHRIAVAIIQNEPPPAIVGTPGPKHVAAPTRSALKGMTP